MRSYGDVSDFMSSPDVDRLRVLIPLDGSLHSEGALALLPALSLVGTVHASLVGVVDDSGSERPEQLESQHRLLESYLKDRVEETGRSGIAAEACVLQGPPAGAILAEAARVNADLIIISSHSRSGIQRWRLGSVADKIVRGAGCNTLVIGNRAEAGAAIRSILLPVDGSDLAEQAIPVAQRYATALGSRLHIVRVVTPYALGIGAPVYGGYANQDTTDILLRAAESHVTQVKDRLGASASTVLLGYPADALLGYVEDQAIDLVIMTSHGRGGLLRTALGSVTDRLVGGPAPVLVVRAEDRPDRQRD